MSHRRSKAWVVYLDALVWAAYLVLVSLISFLNATYLSVTWQTFSWVFYAYIAFYVMSLLVSDRCNYKALRNARYAIVLTAASLFWLWLQSILPIGNYLVDYIFLDKETLAWLDLPSTWSVTPVKTRWLISSNLIVFSLFVVTLCLLDSRRRVKQLLVLIMVVGSLHASIGIAAKYANLYLVSLSQIDGHYDAARAWFVNRNHFASFISLCLIGGLALQLKNLFTVRPNRSLPELVNQLISPQVFSIISLLVGMLAIILSQSRAGFLAIILAIFCVVLIIGKRSQYPLQRRYLVGLTALVLTVLLFNFGDGLLARLVHGTLSTGERIDQWLITWQAIKPQWLLGYGGGSYATVFQIFREYADLRQVLYDQAHNDYLHIWLEQGLIGLSLWLGFLYLVIANGVSIVRTHPSRLVVAISYAALVVILAALLQAWIGYNLQITNIRSYFFIIVALLFAAPTIQFRLTGNNKSNDE